MSLRFLSHNAILILCICSIIFHLRAFAEEGIFLSPDANVQSEIDAAVDAQVSLNEDIDNLASMASTIEPTSNEFIDGVGIASLTEETDSKYEKVAPLDPTLLITGKFVQNSSNKKMVELKGKIIPERHPIGRRKYIYRWILKLHNGSRIPLKSNLRLLQKVKDDDVLDGFVSVKGIWLISPSNENLKFFKVNSMRVIDEPALVEDANEIDDSSKLDNVDAVSKLSNTDLDSKSHNTDEFSEVSEVSNSYDTIKPIKIDKPSRITKIEETIETTKIDSAHAGSLIKRVSKSIKTDKDSCAIESDNLD